MGQRKELVYSYSIFRLKHLPVLFIYAFGEIIILVYLCIHMISM